MNHNLTMRRALPKMFKAFRERKLICQNGGEDTGLVREDGCLCIVGAGLPARTLSEAKRLGKLDNTTHGLRLDGLVKCSEAEEEKFDHLLDLHDSACEGDKFTRRKYRRQLASALNKHAKELSLGLEPLRVS